MSFISKVFLFFLLSITCSLPLSAEEQNVYDKKVLVAILARNKAHVLDKFLQCIYNLDYDKKLITLYVNTNNNSDKTKEVLTSWLEAHQAEYGQVLFENQDNPKVDPSSPHDWTINRLKVLSQIRNESLKKTKECGCDYYFVVDCDNFIRPYTLKELIAKDKPIIAPMLRSIPEQKDVYSNYFYAINEKGYCKYHENYFKILTYEWKGTFKVPVVHCTYLVNAKYIDKLTYVDGSNEYDFAIFSKSARDHNVDQFICNERDFGVLLHFFNSPTLEEEQEIVPLILPNW